MTDHDRDADLLGNALHERVRDERPDLDDLVAGATRAGTRIRRRRRAGASLAAVAGVATIALLGSQLTGSSGTTGGGPTFADQPSVGVPTVPTDADPVTLTGDEALQFVRDRLSQLQDGETDPGAPGPGTPRIRLSELLTVVSVLRDELPADEFRELTAGVRLTAPSAGRPRLTREERVAALDRLLEEFQRVQAERSTD